MGNLESETAVFLMETDRGVEKAATTLSKKCSEYLAARKSAPKVPRRLVLPLSWQAKWQGRPLTHSVFLVIEEDPTVSKRAQITLFNPNGDFRPSPFTAFEDAALRVVQAYYSNQSTVVRNQVQVSATFFSCGPDCMETLRIYEQQIKKTGKSFAKWISKDLSKRSKWEDKEARLRHARHLRRAVEENFFVDESLSQIDFSRI